MVDPLRNVKENTLAVWLTGGCLASNLLLLLVLLVVLMPVARHNEQILVEIQKNINTGAASMVTALHSVSANQQAVIESVATVRDAADVIRAIHQHVEDNQRQLETNQKLIEDNRLLINRVHDQGATDGN